MRKTSKCINKKEGLRLLDYEQGWMSAAEAAAFEQHHLARCAACRESLAFFQPVWAQLKAHPEILDRAAGLAQERSIRRTQLFNQWTLGTATVSVAAALILGLMAYPGPHRPPDRMKALLTLRCGEASDPFRQALAHYQAGRYAEAADAFERVVASSAVATEREPARLLLAMSYGQLGQKEKSREQLIALIGEAGPQSRYRVEAEAGLKKMEPQKKTP